MTRLLIVEDEKIQGEQLRRKLVRNGWEVEVAGSVPEAERKLAAGSFDVVLADVRLPGAPGTALINHSGDARVVMMSAFYGTVDSAVAEMKLGAVDYLRKPIDHDELLERLARAAPPKPPRVVDEMLLGESAAMRSVRDQVCRVAASDFNVLVLGESGTGKRLVARAIHKQSARRAGRFEVFGCAEIAEDLVASELFGHAAGATEARAGLFEAAHGGTVFLDEVGKLPGFTQDRLLRVLQDRTVRRLGAANEQRVDVRVVAATNRDLQALVEQQAFTSTLFHRLRDFEIRLPPLRERREDLFLLATRTLDEACARHGRSPVRLSTAARGAMLAYSWPCNVLELEAAMRGALVRSDGEEIGVQHLPEEIGAQHLPQEVGAQLLPKEVGVQFLPKEIDRRPLPEPGSRDDHFMRAIVANQDHLIDKQGVGVRLLPHELSEQHLREKVGRQRLPKPGSRDDHFMRAIVANQDHVKSDKALANLLGCARETIIRFRKTWDIRNPRRR